MKKFLTLAAVLLLALTLLWGCTNNTDTPADTNTNVPLYYYMDRDTVPAADANGEYPLRFAQDGEVKTFKATDSALVESLKYQDFVGLTLEGDKVVGFTRMIDLPYTRVAQDYYVTSIGGNKVKLSGPENYEVLDLLVTIPEDLPVYDFTPQSKNPGAPTTLTKNDAVSIVADESGNYLFCCVTVRPSAPHEGKQYCQHCESEVSWQDWIAPNKLPVTPGHYILANDVNVAKVTTAASGNICLDLNGKTITQTTFGEQLYRVAGTVVMSIMDSVGTGKVVPNSTDGTSGTSKSGLGFYISGFEATLNLYSGTIDASQSVASFGNGIYMESGTFNMYGGTILGGSSYGAGGCAVSAKGNVNIYGGKIVGGKLIDATYHLPIGGAALRVLGVATIYGGEIIGGETDTVGGAIRVCGDAFGGAKLILKGGTITGGKAPEGGAIFVGSTSEIEISGDVKITGNENGNLHLDRAVKIVLGDAGMGENAEIGISMTEPGEFITGVPDGVDISKYFISDDASTKIVNNGNGSWGLK